MAWFAHIGGFIAGMILVQIMGTRKPLLARAAISTGKRLMIDVLAIAAHPDDVEQTCGGTLLRMAEAGYRTGIIDLTAGDMGTRGSPEIRVAESQSRGENPEGLASRESAFPRCAPRKLHGRHA